MHGRDNTRSNSRSSYLIECIERAMGGGEWRKVEEHKMKVRVERGLTPHVSSERPQWMIRRRCLAAKTLLAAAMSSLGVGTDGTPVLDGIGTRRGMV